MVPYRCTVTPQPSTSCRLNAEPLCPAQVSIYGLETAAQPDTVSAAGGDFAALLSTQSTEGGLPGSQSMSNCMLIQVICV